MLSVKNLTKSYEAASGTVHALDNVNFKVETGQFASIIGKSGSGKSTLLSLLGALDTPSDGEILVDDTDIAKLSGSKQTTYRAHKIGFVFQHYNLIPNLSALENVMLALEFGGVKSARARKERALGLSRNRRQPLSAHHGARGAGGVARIDHRPAIGLRHFASGSRARAARGYSHARRPGVLSHSRNRSSSIAAAKR